MQGSIKRHRKRIWSDHLTFCLMCIFLTDRDSEWSKLPSLALKVFLNGRGSRQHDLIKIFFLKPQKMLVLLVR